RSHRRNDYGNREPCRNLEGLVRHGQGQQWPLPRQQVVGGWLGLVVVRCCQPFEDDIDRLQDRLSKLSCTGTGFRLGLCRRIPATQPIPHFPPKPTQAIDGFTTKTPKQEDQQRWTCRKG